MAKKEYTLKELKQKAASYCAMAEHCVQEVKKKLTAWNVAENDADDIIAALIEEDFINEKRYATLFVKDKFRLNKWGKIKIAMALRQKMIDRPIIDEALQIIDQGEYEEILTTLLEKKSTQITYRYPYEKQGKLFRYAQGRGFETYTIETALKRVLTKQNSND